jgi:hypothetical protein
MHVLDKILLTGFTFVIERRKENYAWLRSLKVQCIRCPENDPVCLVFHHRNPDEKEINVTTAVNNGWSRQRILKEIEKCDVLCANCHAKEHDKYKSATVMVTNGPPKPY